MPPLRDHVWILGSIMCNLYSAMMIKVQVSRAGIFPLLWPDRARFIARLLLNPWVVTSLAATFVGGLLWMVGMTKLKLSYAYPFTALGYAGVLILSALFLNESLSWQKAVGVLFIAIGIYVGCRG